jgi:hypothetical protein
MPQEELHSTRTGAPGRGNACHGADLLVQLFDFVEQILASVLGNP